MQDNILNWKEAAKAWGEGKEIQFRLREIYLPVEVDRWKDFGGNHDNIVFSMNTEYRLKPKTKIVPWTMEDVPMPICWIREKGASRKSIVLDVKSSNVFIHTSVISYFGLSEDYEYSTDGVVFKPCHKLEEVKG